MSTGGRNFSRKQAFEREVKELYLKMSMGGLVAAEATLETTEPIVLTSVALGAARNTNTFTLEVEAPAANPTDTVLADFTGTAAAIICTITPNDGTNNGAVPVDLTSAELVELINTGAVVGKTVTVTDASALRNDQTAEGGDATPLADAGEGDELEATFAGGGAEDPELLSSYGIASVARSAVGEYLVTLEDVYTSFKACQARFEKETGVDARIQLKEEAVADAKTFSFYVLAGATPTDLSAEEILFLSLDLKNCEDEE